MSNDPSILDNLILRCKESGLRKTRALNALLETLLEQDRPMTLSELATSDQLSNLCDQATVFRLLQRLLDKGIVRRLGLHERAAYFTLLITGRHQDFLICTECGDIRAIHAPCPVHELEKEIQASTGFKGLYHELEFFGTCPECATA